MRILLLACCFAPFSCATALVQSETETSQTETKTLDEVLVTGEYPGPGLWRVSKVTGDGEHVLWILGTVGPMPKSITWRSHKVEEIVANSQEIIGEVGVGITFEKRVGVFKALTLLPSIFQARKNPDNKRLEDVVPAEIYSRWQILKAKYIGNDNGIEKWRPTFAGDKLKDKAFEKLALYSSSPVWQVIGPFAKQHKIKVTSPSVIGKIPNERIRATIKQFIKTPLADVACFAAVVSSVEALEDIATIQTRARAWATGDLATLRQLPALPDTQVPCNNAIMNSEIVKDLHLKDFDSSPAALNRLWLAAAENALSTNQSTFAVLPISELFDHTGKIETLRQKGYTVVEP